MTSTRTSGSVCPLIARAVALGILVAALAATRLDAQTYIYTLTLRGVVTVNGTQLDEHNTKFGTNPVRFIETAYSDLAVEGSNRYELRRDGRIYSNGLRLHELPWPGFAGAMWISMQVSGGATYALRQDGAIGVNDKITLRLDFGDFRFSKLVFHQGATWSLRTDGAVFRNGEASPTFHFQAGDGNFGVPDGEAVDTEWISMAFDPTNPDDLYALRRDGYVFRGTLGGDEEGVEVAALPFRSTTALFLADFYYDIEFLAGGTWLALQGIGDIYSSLSTIVPYAEYPGHLTDEDRLFADLATAGNEFVGVRRDGRVYANIAATEVLQISKKDHVHVAISDQEPDLTNFKNAKPEVARYGTTTLDGTALEIPVVATDTDKASDDLIVTPLDPLPPGATWDAGARSLLWADPGPAGTYQFQFEVDDGVAKPVKVKYKIKIRDPNPPEKKNQKPFKQKISKAQALIGVEFTLKIIADDPDGDPVTIRVNTFEYPFDSGAIFNPATSELVWTPSAEDQGTAKVKFYLDDGVAGERTMTLKIRIRAPLLIDPDPIP